MFSFRNTNRHKHHSTFLDIQWITMIEWHLCRLMPPNRIHNVTQSIISFLYATVKQKWNDYYLLLESTSKLNQCRLSYIVNYLHYALRFLFPVFISCLFVFYSVFCFLLSKIKVNKFQKDEKHVKRNTYYQ